MIFDKIRDNSLVFDIGCASGYLAEVLAKKKKCSVVGLEIDEADAKRAENFCEIVLRDDIETVAWEKKLFGKKFDYIIFADVLEHLKDPEKVLQRVKSFLKEDGSILISIPNVAHVSIRLELLKGRFIPEDVGILDNTHLKYFTKETFSDLVTKAGYRINDSYQSSFDFPELQIKKILSNSGLVLNEKTIKELTSPEAVAFQYFFELKSGNLTDIKNKKEEQKPIYFVTKYLKDVERDHQKFKKEQTRNVKILEKENKLLQEKLNELNADNTMQNKPLFQRIKIRLKNSLR